MIIRFSLTVQAHPINGFRQAHVALEKRENAFTGLCSIRSDAVVFCDSPLAYDMGDWIFSEEKGTGDTADEL